MKLIMENWKSFTSRVINEENFNSLERLETALGDNYSQYAPAGTSGYANEEELAGIAPFVKNERQLNMVVAQIKKRSGKELLDYFKRKESSANKAARVPTQSGSRKYNIVQHKAIVMQLLATPGKEKQLADYMKNNASEFTPEFIKAVKDGNYPKVRRLAKQPGK